MYLLIMKTFFNVPYFFIPLIRPTPSKMQQPEEAAAAAVAHFRKVVVDNAYRVYGNWCYHLIADHSIMRNSTMVVTWFQLSGLGGSPDNNDQQVTLTVEFKVNKCLHPKVFKMVCTSLDTAIVSIFGFVNDYYVCANCGELVKTGATCDACQFFRAYQAYNKQEYICAICQENVLRTMLKCGHAFHATCINKMEPVGIRCPVCRKELDEDEIEFFFGCDYEDNSSDNDEED